MPEISNGGVNISYDVVGEGRPLLLFHGLWCDRSWWTEPGYVDQLANDHRLVMVDIRGHGLSGKPHDPAAYSGDQLVGDVLAVADAEDLDRFAIWGHSYGGWVAWITAYSVPERVPAIITTGAWDPRPARGPSEAMEEYNDALRRGGTTALVDLFRIQDGEDHDREFPVWARDVTLRADPEALLAAGAPELVPEGVPDEELSSFPVPALIIAGEFDDVDDDAAEVEATIPNGQRLRLPGLGHGGSCIASGLTVPVAREFLDRWLP